MKTINFILKVVIGIFFIYCSLTQAQVRGTTQSGKLFPENNRGDANTIADNLPPEIRLISPQVNSLDTLMMKNGTLNIRGAVSDSSGIEKVMVNGELAYLKVKEFYSSINLHPGINEISIEATDAAINKSKFNFFIEYQKDVLPPELVWIQPDIINNDNIIVDSTVIEFNFLFRDESKIENVFLNGLKLEAFDNYNYMAVIPLTEGINFIDIEAVDDFGNKQVYKGKVNNIADLSGPQVTIIEPEPKRGIKVVHKDEIVLIKGVAKDKSGVKAVSINNRIAEVKESGEFEINFYLAPGENEIIVKAEDNVSNQSIDTFYIVRESKEVLTEGEYIALIVGINSYSGDYWHPLNNAVNDAIEFGRVLKESYNFSKVEYLLDENATRQNIIQELEALTDPINVSPNDNVLIFYAGHGQLKLNKGFWVPVDANSNSIADYVSNETIKTIIGNINSKHTLLIADACFAGDIYRGMEDQKAVFDPNNMAKYYQEIYRKPSRIVVTSGGIEQVKDSGFEGHSVFSYYLIEALKNNPYSFYSVNQLFQEFSPAVVNNSEQTPQIDHLKDVGDQGGEFVFFKTSQ